MKFISSYVVESCCLQRFFLQLMGSNLFSQKFPVSKGAFPRNDRGQDFGSSCLIDALEISSVCVLKLTI